MCAWWRIAATTSLAALAWPALTYAQGAGADWPDGVAPRDSYVEALTAMQPAWRSTGTASWSDAGHDPWAALPGTPMGWPGFVSGAAVHVWGPLQGRWRFASLVGQPYSAAPGVAATDAGYAPQVPIATEAAFVPVMASYRVGSAYRVAFAWGVVAPSGVRNASASNVWSMKPKGAYTRELSATNMDSSTIVAIGTFSRQAVANYQNGAVGRVEALVMRRSPDGWGFGGVAAALQPYNTITSPLPGHMPNAVDGGGYALGVGPQLNWSTHWMGSGVELQYRWIHEFRAPNGHTDQPMLLSATLHL